LLTINRLWSFAGKEPAGRNDIAAVMPAGNGYKSIGAERREFRK
jgi:hypothetical protein